MSFFFSGLFGEMIIGLKVLLVRRNYAYPDVLLDEGILFELYEGLLPDPELSFNAFPPRPILEMALEKLSSRSAPIIGDSSVSCSL